MLAGSTGAARSDFIGDECEAAEATFCEARLRVIVRLRHLRAAFHANPAPESQAATADGIDNLAAYAYRVTLNAAADILREAYPDRYRLDCTLRYIVRHSKRLTVWDTQAESQKRKQVVGLRQWPRVGSEEFPSFRQSVYHAYLEAARQRWRLINTDASELETLPCFTANLVP